MIGNSNGLVDNIYHFLWLKDDSFVNTNFNLRLPDTIIFRFGLPQVWYFTNKAGELQMRKQESKTTEKIIAKFCTRKDKMNSIVAYYIYPEKYNSQVPFQGKPMTILDVEEKICVYYITYQMFPEFINSLKKPAEGILQKFVEPLGTNESVIQAVWSPSVCILSKKQNYRDLYDMSYDPYERCATFDGAEVYSRCIPIRGKEISQEIRQQCQQIVTKLSDLSFGQLTISRAVFYFKADKQNKLWFLYTSSLRFQGEHPVQQSTFSTLWSGVRKNNTPLAFTTNFECPHQVKNSMTVNTMHPVKLLKDIECFDCGSLCQKLDLYNLTYELIIKHFELNVNQNLISEISVLNPGIQQEQHLRDIRSHIPPLILKLYPHLTVPLYEQLQFNDAFLFKTVRLCEKCFLRYSEAKPMISGAKLRIKESKKPVRLQSASILHRRPDLKQFLVDTNKQNQSPLNYHFGVNERMNSLTSSCKSQLSTHAYTMSQKNKFSLDLDLQSVKSTKFRKLFSGKQ